LHKFCKDRRRSPSGYFECGDTTHFIADCPKRNDYTKRNDYSKDNDYNKNNDKRKYRFGDNKKKKF
jgi:hypothetical protein